jgi:RNA polymerase sigma factor (TIGR02999 family)
MTQLLADVRDGGRGAFDRLLAAVYDELRQVAQRQMRKEREGHTLNTTGLVHEAYLKLVDQTQVDWRDRAHFFGIASRAMRQICVRFW